jgi:hypothetical protein
VEELLPETLKKRAISRPRTVRVNTCLMTVDEAKAWLTEPPEEHSAFAVKASLSSHTHTQLFYRFSLSLSIQVLFATS